MAASLPEGYGELARWSIGGMSARLAWALVLLSAAAFAAAAGVGLAVAQTASGGAAIGLDPRGLLLGAVAAPVLHELVHAAAFRALGARPRFGAKLRTRLGPVLYVSAPGAYLGRGRYLAAGLAPLALLTPALWAALALAPADGPIAGALIVAAGLHAGGSIGDALLARAALAHPADARFEDTGEGFVVYGPARPGRAAQRSNSERRSPSRCR